MRWRKFGVVKKGMILLGGLGLVWFGWWVSDIPIGYYDFKERCQKEGGVEIKGEINPYIGWLVKNEAQARYVTSAFSVLYARFLSNDNRWVDVRYKGGNSWFSESYFIGSADEEERPGYQFEIRNETVPDAIRLRSRTLVLKDISSGFDCVRMPGFWLTCSPKRSCLSQLVLLIHGLILSVLCWVEVTRFVALPLLMSGILLILFFDSGVL